MHKAAQLLPGDAKTDARDAFVIATTALRMPDTLRSVDRDSEILANLKVLAGFDDDLAHETTRSINRLRSLLLQIHPALERVFAGSRLTTDLSLDLLARYGGPTGLARSGRRRATTWATKTGHRGTDKLVEDIFQALSEQTVIVSGTEAVEQIVPAIATTIKTLKTQRAELAVKVETLLEDFPLHQVLASMPGIGAKTTANILLTIGDASGFPSAAHLAAYAGIAPTPRRSGLFIRGEHPARGGNKQLKNALFHSAFVAAFCDPESHAYYERKRPRANDTTPRSSASPDDAATSSTPCSKPAPSTSPDTHKRKPPQLNKTIGTPRYEPNWWTRCASRSFRSSTPPGRYA